jgi:ferredoxin
MAVPAVPRYGARRGRAPARPTREVTVTRYRIEVDRAVCQGTGLCVGVAPEHFALDDSFVSRPVHDVVDADDDLLDAAECCPVEAITLTDVDTGRPVEH